MGNLFNLSAKQAFVDSQKNIEAMMLGNARTADAKLVKDSDATMFLSNALEKVDPVLHKPLFNFFWSEAMPIMYGGGALEYSSFFRVNYNAYDANKNVTSGNNNVITEVKATIQKYQTVVKAYAWSISIGWIDEMKLSQVSSDIVSQLDDGVRLHYNQKLDDVAFYGFVNEGNADAYGLINNPNVATIVADATFDTLTASQIVEKLNELLASIVQNTELNKQYPVNHILVPPSLYTLLAQPMVIGGENGVGIYKNILEYFKENNYVKLIYGRDDIQVLPIPYLETAGADSSRRIVAYCYDESCIRMPLPMDLTRGATMFDVGAMEYKTVFVSFIGQPQFIYLKTIGYLDKV